MLTLLLLAALLCLGDARVCTAKPSYCLKHMRASPGVARLITRRPGLFFRASRPACWNPHPPFPEDDVVIDFSAETLAGDVRSFVFDEAMNFTSLTILGARSHKEILPLHSVIQVRSDLYVEQDIMVPRHGLFYLEGRKGNGVRVRAERLVLDGATLAGDGRLDLNSFETNPGSYISPGRSFVSKCGPSCFSLPKKAAGVRYGNITLVTSNQADLSGATIVIKKIGGHGTLGPQEHDEFRASFASAPRGAVLILGDGPTVVPEDGKSPYNRVNWRESDVPHDPSSAICIASGTGGVDYSPSSDRCRAFMINHGARMLFKPSPDTDPRMRWVHFVDHLDTVASSQNVIPFRLHNCCNELMRRTFISRRVYERISPRRQVVSNAVRDRMVKFIALSPALAQIAPAAARKAAGTYKPTTAPPLVPKGKIVGKSCVFCTPGTVKPRIAQQCVPSSTILIHTDCCPTGYMGDNCDEPVSCTCSHHGACEEDGFCMCDPGFSGYDCAHPICPVAPNGQECNGRNVGLCTVKEDDPESIPFCTCRPGFTGKACEVPVCAPTCKGHDLCIANVTEPHCWETSFKDVSHCENGGEFLEHLIYQDGYNGPACKCPAGFEGPRCQVPICPNACSHAGECVVKGGQPQCECLVGYSGSDCSGQFCHSERCQNNGTCVMRYGQAECVCKFGTGGPTCAESTETLPRVNLFAQDALHDGALLIYIMLGSLALAVLVIGGIALYKRRQNNAKDAAEKRSQANMNLNY